MSAPKTRRSLAHRISGISLQRWLIFGFIEATALALVLTGIMRGQWPAILIGVLLGLVYAPLRAGGWSWIRRRRAQVTRSPRSPRR